MGRPGATALAAVNALAAATVVVWPALAFGAAFLFDAPDAASSPATVALALASVGYPLPVGLGNWLFWTGRRREGPRRLALYTAVSASGPALVAVLVRVLDTGP